MAVPGCKLLRINLSDRSVRNELVPEEVLREYVGGRGLGIHYLYKELAPGADPLGDENKLLFVSGPLAGTSAQSVSRWMVVTKSPLTGGFARGVAGADFGAWLKFAGYEVAIVEGKAEKPVYIHLTPDGCRVHDAGELWGKNTVATQDWLRKAHGDDTRTACIGPGGERLVRFAAIVSGRRTASRGGVGTVMGSKNLKAVAITAKRNLVLADPESFRDLVKRQVEFNRNSRSYEHHREMGTTATQDITNEIGIYPVRNFRQGKQAGYEKIVGEEYKKLRTGDFGCYSCAVRCGKQHNVRTGPYAGACSEGPEYESIWAFTGPIDSTSLEASIAADQICDDLGIDTISTGSTIGFAYELYEKGILTRRDTDGLELTYGNHEAMVALVRKIGTREGIGNMLAEGSLRAGRMIGKGAEAYAIQVKGMELPAYEPRGAKAQGFNYATASIGASHCYGYASQEIFGAPFPRKVDRFTEEDKADIVIYNQDNAAKNETGIICAFAAGWEWAKPLFGPMLVAATGFAEFGDEAYLWKVGSRIFNLERAFNVRQGLGRKDDTLPVRMLTEPLQTNGAPGEGQVVRSQDVFLDNYYAARGWTRDGLPTAQRLAELGLSDVARDLEYQSG
jgi:aldehyde:ferredoxin oxidoreductase